MSEIPTATGDPRSCEVVAVHAGSGPSDPCECIPAGHCLSGPRLRHLRESERIVVTDHLGPIGLAAYKRADGTVRVVHELLLDRRLDGAQAARVTEMLLSALELVAYDEGVCCLTFLVHDAVVMAPFEHRGYMSMALGSSSTWLQRKLGWLGWDAIPSERRH